MTLTEVIDTRTEAEIKRMFGQKPDILSFLLNHERLPLLKNNLLKEIKEMEYSSVSLDKKRINFVIDAFAKTFCTQALRHAEQQAVSETEKQRRLKEESEFNEIQEMLEEDSKGERDFTESHDGQKI